MSLTPDQFPIRLHGEHYRMVCSCGTVLGQCRCPGPKPDIVAHESCEACRRQPDPAPAIVEPARCEACGRSSGDFLTLLEANDRYGYAKSKCPACLLTDLPRKLLTL